MNKQITYWIEQPDELAAGIIGFSDIITITVDSGDPGGEVEGKDSFIEHMRQALTKWYDGARVTLQCPWQEEELENE